MEGRGSAPDKEGVCDVAANADEIVTGCVLTNSASACGSKVRSFGPGIYGRSRNACDMVAISALSENSTMNFTLFYAWQSDRFQKTNRYLIL
jgi:hypothetical protein